MAQAVDWFMVGDSMERLARRYSPRSPTGKHLIIVFAALQACREELGDDTFVPPETWWRITDKDGHRHAVGAKRKPRTDYELNLLSEEYGQVTMPPGTFTILDEPITYEQCEQWVEVGAVEPSQCVLKPDAETLLFEAAEVLKLILGGVPAANTTAADVLAGITEWFAEHSEGTKS